METHLFNPRQMGAIPGRTSTRFKVWAPNASSVSVVGEFNNWDGATHPMKLEAEGMWFLEVEGALIGHQYQFYLLNGETCLRKNDAYAREIHPETKRGVIYRDDFEWEYPDCVLPNWNELVIYELHIGNFSSTRQNDPGRFAQVAGRLPYLKSLGVNAIEIMPPMAFPTDRSWGYNLTNPFAVESSYGGANGLKRLVDAAHAQKMSIIIDVVCNHFGPDNLDLWQYDGWSENGKGGIYFYNDHRAATPWGENRPDYGRDEVRQYIHDYALLWLEMFKVDGIRLDSTIYVRNWRGENNQPEADLPEGWSLMQWINNDVQKFFPGRITIAEDIQQNNWITKSTTEGGMGYGSQWCGAFIYPVREAVVAVEDPSRSIAAIAQAIEFRYNLDAIQRVIYSESHDSVANGRARLPQEIDQGNAGSYYAQKRSTLAAGITLTTPGIPMLFEGQEFLEDGSFRDDVTLDWSKLETYRGINRLYRDLIHLRRNIHRNTKGLVGPHVRVHHINEADKVIAYHRWENGGPKDDVIIVANFSQHEHDGGYRIGFPRAGEWTIRLNSDWKGYSPEFHDIGLTVAKVEAEEKRQDGFNYSGVIKLPSYGFVLFSQDDQS